MKLRVSFGGLRGISALILMCFCSSANAEQNSYRFELTPFAAYRVGGSFEGQDGDSQIDLDDSDAVGISLNIRANPNGQYELLYARQDTTATTSGFFTGDPTIDIDVDYLQFGGTYLFDGDKARPFIAMTLGLTRFDPALPDTSSDQFFSGSFGGGVQLNANSRLGLRLEARVYATLVDDNSRLFCSSIDGAGSCIVQVEGRLLTQWEARAGLVFRF